MARAWFAALALLAALPANAQVPPSGRAAFPCPYATIGWALSWTGKTITSASYDSGTQILYLVFNYTRAQAFYPVGVGVMTSLSYTQNPMAIYPTIVSQYHQLLLTEKDNCPLKWEFGGNGYGYIWTD
jgi:hypothetical protein